MNNLAHTRLQCDEDAPSSSFPVNIYIGHREAVVHLLLDLKCQQRTDRFLHPSQSKTAMNEFPEAFR